MFPCLFSVSGLDVFGLEHGGRTATWRFKPWTGGRTDQKWLPLLEQECFPGTYGVIWVAGG